MPVILETALDQNAKMNDAGLKTTSGAGTVSSSAKVYDFKQGASADRVPVTRFDVLVHLKETEVDSSNELMTVELQLSNSSSFSSVSAIKPLIRAGHTSKTFEAANTALGVYRFSATNEVAGATYRYARLYHRIEGTIGTGFSYEGWITPRS